MKSIYLYILAALISTFSVQAQNTSDYGNVSSLSLGGSIVTLEGVDALHGNQAGLSQIEGLVVDVNAIQKFGLADISKISLGIAYPVGDGAIGLNIQGLGNGALREQKVGLFYTRQLHKNFSLSAQADWLSYRIDEYGSTNKFTVEVGAQAIVNSKLSVGVHIYSPGEVEFTENQPIPSILDLGVAYKANKKFTLHTGIRKIIDRPLEVIFGMDYDIHDKLALRIGGNSAVNEFTGGIKVDISNSLSVLLGVAYHNTLGLSPGIGFQHY